MENLDKDQLRSAAIAAMSYEDALLRLEHIIQGLEQGSFKLDSLMDHISEAKEIIDVCKEKLRKIEGQVDGIL